MPSVSTFAVGARGYTYGAANLAASIKHFSPGVRVVLYTDGKNLRYLKPHHVASFDDIVTLGEDEYMTEGRLDPGKLKAGISGILVEQETVFVDADSIAVAPIEDELVRLQNDGRDFVCQVIPTYLPWASAQDIRQKIGDESAPIYGVQTSWFFIRKGPLGSLVKELCDARAWDRGELRHRWGSSLPDELLYTHACALMKHDPTGAELMLFGNKVDTGTLTETCNKYKFITLYGNGGSKPHVRGIYLDMYDVILRRAYMARRAEHIYKYNYILADKYLTK